MSLLQKLRAQAAEREKTRAPITADNISLRGTGLTKRVLERDAKAYEKDAKASMQKPDFLAVAEAEKHFAEGIEATLEAMRRENAKSDIQLDESQIAAFAGIMHNKVCVLIGAAGTGKTTLTKKVMGKLSETLNVVKAEDVIWITCENENGDKFRALLREAKSQGWRILDTVKTQEMPGVALAAYTGRASQQIKRAVPEEWHNNISTIHRLLGYAPVFEDYDYEDPITHYIEPRTRKVFRPSFDANCKLPFTFYVFDEGSMIPIPLFNEWVEAAPSNSRVLIIGDIHQLPPPYGKGVLGYAMKKWPVFELKHIHRQAAGNAIIANAHKILNGRQPENASNFHLIGNNTKNGKLAPTGQNELQGYFLTVIKQLAGLKNKDGEPLYDPLKDNIIVPSNKNFCGTDQLNEKLVLMFNPEQKDNGIIVNKRIKIHTGNNFAFFALRDKVMITKNINTIEPPITNGMLGIVESLNLNGRYDQKRSQVDDADDGGDLDMGEIELDMGNMEAALNEAFGGKDEKEENEDQSADQRQSSHVMVIRFENGQTYECSTAGDYRAVKHGYATTCHKAQGGEYPNVIILCHSINSVQLTQEWLYTAVTRARNNVYLVCNQRGLDQAIKRQAIKGYTLQEKIKAYALANDIQDSDMFDPMKHPILWEPKEI